jgi:hypothetical protein
MSEYHKWQRDRDRELRRKRWAEKSAVTKRAQKQKVSLANVPSMDSGRDDENHGSNPSPANLQVGSEGPRLPYRRDA